MWIRPSGYFNIKATRLKNYSDWYTRQGEYEKLVSLDTTRLREGLLSVKGVGPETADDMLLYGFERPVFVIDAYTRRLFSRLDVISGDEQYESIRHAFEQQLSRQKHKAKLFNEYHALIVVHAKDYCKKNPLCTTCCVKDICRYKAI